MHISISKYTNEPIYEQIYNSIKNQIISGTIKEGEKLPSIRELAKLLNVSIITTKRAYSELENEKFIITYKGKGSYILQYNKTQYLETKKEELINDLKKIIIDMNNLKINKDDIKSIINKIIQEV